MFRVSYVFVCTYVRMSSSETVFVRTSSYVRTTFWSATATRYVLLLMLMLMLMLMLIHTDAADTYAYAYAAVYYVNERECLCSALVTM